MAELYHYTTTASLLGMLKDCSRENPNLTMWATHCNYLNDRSEFLLGRELCNKAICEHAEELGIPDAEKIKNIINDSAVTSFTKDLCFGSSTSPQTIGGGYPYLFSLSRAKDSLPMWGLYAKDGNGIAVVFDEEALKKQFRGKNCFYCQENDTSPIKKLIAKAYVTIIDPCLKQDDGIIIFGLQQVYTELSSYIKHKSFEFEQEFRVIATESTHISFREKAGLIVPYVEQKIPVKCIKGIIVGPTSDFGRMKEALTILLMNKDIDICKIDIIQSEVPYRG